MSVEICPAEESDKHIIQSMLDDYLRELAGYREIGTGAVDAASYPYFDVYWSEAGRYPFMMICGEEVAGFVFIRGPDSTGTNGFQVAEFYVKPPFRRQGVGRQAAFALWNRFSGEWELQAHARNEKAVKFWHTCVQAASEDTLQVTEVQAKDGRRLQFNFAIRPDTSS